jgi:hypothetical protein
MFARLGVTPGFSGNIRATMPRPTFLLPLLLAFTPLPGCAQQDPSSLPGGSKLVAESPAPLSYTATEKGTLYLHDRAADQVLFATPLAPNQRIDIDPQTGRITVNGTAIPAGPTLTAGKNYELFFKPATGREYHPAYNP